MVHKVASSAEFNEKIAQDKLVCSFFFLFLFSFSFLSIPHLLSFLLSQVVVDYFAVWCGPCKVIAPYLDTLATENPEVEFIKVDVDELEVRLLLLPLSLHLFGYFTHTHPGILFCMSQDLK